MARLSILLFCIFCVSGTLALADDGRDIDAGFGEWKGLFDGKSTKGWQNAKPKRQAGGRTSGPLRMAPSPISGAESMTSAPWKSSPITS